MKQLDKGKGLKNKKLKALIALGLALFVASAGVANSFAEHESDSVLPEPVAAVTLTADLPKAELIVIEASELQEEKVKGKRSESFLCLAVQTIGYALSTALAVVFRTLGQPLLVKLLFWVCIAFFALLASYFGLKAAFPELSVKELMTPKHISLVLLGVAFAAVISELLPIYYDLSEWMLYIRFAAVVLIGLAVTEIIYNRVEA